MKLIVGLGNPGKEYENTRHNIGFKIIDSVARNQGIRFNLENKFEAEVGEYKEAKFVKPQTFMNESGRSVRKIKDFYKIDDSNIVVVHDDVDLELGKIKIVLGGSSAGHKGVQSIIDNIGSENFWRVRVGVGRSDQIPTEAWVLMNFEDSQKIDIIVGRATDIVLETLATEGLTASTYEIE